MKTKSQEASTSSSVPACRSAILSRSRWSLPLAPTTSLQVRTEHVRQLSDLLDQVLRHRALEGLGPDHDGDPAGGAGEEHGRLAGRVGSADDVDVLVLAGLRLGRRRPVVDAGAGEGVDARDRQPAVGHARWSGSRRGPRAGCGRPGATTRADPHTSRLETSEVSSISAPNRRAWVVALQARSPPPMPDGKPR